MKFMRANIFICIVIVLIVTKQSFSAKENDLLSRKFKRNKIYTEQERNNYSKCEDR